MKRIQRAALSDLKPRNINGKPSGSVPGRREVVADAPQRPREQLRSASQAGKIVARVYGGGIVDAPGWSGPNGEGTDLGPLTTNQSRSKK